MEIRVEAGEVLDSSNADWETFCDITGLSVYAIAEGMRRDKEYKLTQEQAEKVGILEGSG